MVHFLVDISSSMGGLAGAEGSQSKLDLVKSMIVTNVCQRKLTSKTFEVAVTTYGDRTTSNHMQNEEGYERINQVIKMDVPAQSFTQEVLNAIHSRNGIDENRSTIASLMATFDALIQAKANYKFNRVMVLVTDGESRIVEDEADMEDVTSLIASMNNPNPKGETKVEPIPLYVIVVGKVAPDSTRVKRENCKLLRSCVMQTR